MTFADTLTLYQNRLQPVLSHHLAAQSLSAPNTPLTDAMQYATLEGGKRLRPFLVYCTGEFFHAPLDTLDHLAAAIELIHSFSLIHDDLPEMDNGTLRHGLPATHIKFGHATALLAGDALLVKAFDIIINLPSDTLSSDQKISVLQTLTAAIGANGMAGGQALELAVSAQPQPNTATLRTVNALKTGQLFIASVVLGALAAHNVHPDQLNAFKIYADHLGLAFQIKDDLLDIHSHETALGKNTNADKKNHKQTYPNTLGISQTQTALKAAGDQALNALHQANINSPSHEALVHFITSDAP
jgi:farnesyl diphosphate synthase